MARKSLLVVVAGAAAVGIIATGAAAGAALTGGENERFGVAVSSSPSTGGTPSDDFVSPSDDSTAPGDDDRTAPPSNGPTSKAPAADAISLDRAVEIALATTGGGTVVDTEREWEHGRAAWEIEIVKGGVEHDVYVDRATGGIVKYDRDDDRDDHDDRDDDDDRHDGDDRSGKGRGGHDD